MKVSRNSLLCSKGSPVPEGFAKLGQKVSKVFVSDNAMDL